MEVTAGLVTGFEGSPEELDEGAAVVVEAGADDGVPWPPVILKRPV